MKPLKIQGREVDMTVEPAGDKLTVTIEDARRQAVLNINNTSQAVRERLADWFIISYAEEHNKFTFLMARM